MKCTVRFERDEEGWWVATIPEVPGVVTQGKTIEQARKRVREALAAILDDEATAEAAEFTDDVQLPAPVGRRLKASHAARAQVEIAAAKAKKATVDAVAALSELGISRRDASVLIGLSHQRIQQLTSK